MYQVIKRDGKIAEFNIQKISDDETHLGVLEGHAQGVAINPVTGATRALMVRQGQIGVFKVYDADEAGEGADAWLLGMKVDDIPPFVQVQIAQDPAARVRVPKDLQKSLTEALQDLLKKQCSRWMIPTSPCCPGTARLRGPRV